jgi:hypothetical protein
MYSARCCTKEMGDEARQQWGDNRNGVGKYKVMIETGMASAR